MQSKHLIIVAVIGIILFLLPSLTAEAANTVSVNGTSNNTATQLTAIWAEYNNLSVTTGAGNTTVTLTVSGKTNYAQAVMYGRIKRNSVVLESFNLTTSFYPQTVTFVAPYAETEGTHYYSFEAYCTSGRLCTIYNRTLSVQYLAAGEYLTSSYNATYDSYISNLQGNDTVINASIAALQGNDTVINTSISALQGNDTVINASIAALQGNDTVINASILGTQNNDTTFDSYLNQNVKTTASPTFSTVNANLSANNVTTTLLNVSGVNVTAAPCLYGFGGDYTYTICTDGTTVYAKNGSTGKIDYSGTEFYNIIDNAINSTSDGGTIYLREGIYTLPDNKNNSINITKPMSLIATPNTTIVAGAAQYTSIIRVLSTHHVLINMLRVDGKGIENNLGAGVWASSNDVPSSHGIYIFNSSNTIVSNVFINNTLRSSIVVAENSTNTYLTNINASNSLGDHLLYVSESIGTSVSNYHGNGYFSHSSAFKIGSGTNGLFANDSNIANIYYTRYLTNPNSYVESDSSIFSVTSNSKRTNINNINIILSDGNSDGVYGILATGDSNINNANIAGNFSGSNQAIYLSTAKVNLNNVNLEVNGTGRGIRLVSLNNGSAFNLNNILIEALNNKISNGIFMDSVSTHNATLTLSNIKINATTGIRLTPDGITTLSESNVLFESTTQRNYNTNVYAPYGVNFGIRNSAPTAVGFGDTYKNSTSKDITCGYDGTNWLNATGDTVVC